MAKGLILLSLSLWLYFPTLRFMVRCWKASEDLSYSFLMPIVIGYIIYQKRGALRSLPISGSWAGLPFFLFGLCLFWLGELGGEYFIQYVSLWFLLIGAIWSLAGMEVVRANVFPLVLLVSMFPPPEFALRKMTASLQLISSVLGVASLRLVGYSAHREGNVIDLGGQQLQVVEACSGLRYVIPLMVLALLLGYFWRRRLWERVVLVISAVPIAILTNALRITVVGMLCQSFGLRVTEGFYHDLQGLFIFLAALNLLFLELWFLRRIPFGGAVERGVERGRTSSRVVDQVHGMEGPRHGGWVSFAVMTLLFGASCATYHFVNFREDVPPVRSLSEFPLQMGGWSGERAVMEQRFIDALDLTDYVLADYRDVNGKTVNFYTAYYQSQRKGESIHSPATCLRGSGWVLKEAGPLTIATPGLWGGTMTVASGVMERPDQRELVLYWFQKGGRVLDNVYALKWFVFWDALTQRRTDGALVRVMTPIYPDEAVEGARRRLLSFVQDAAPILQEFIPGGEIPVAGQRLTTRDGIQAVPSSPPAGRAGTSSAQATQTTSWGRPYEA